MHYIAFVLCSLNETFDVYIIAAFPSVASSELGVYVCNMVNKDGV